MAGAMLVVKASFKEVLACQEIEITAVVTSRLRPDSHLKVQIAHEHSGVGFLLESSRSLTSEMASSGDVGSSIKVLATGVKEVDLIVVESQGSVLLRLVVDNSSIGTNARNSIERRALVEVSKGAILLDLPGSGELIEPVVRLLELLLQESEVLHNGSAVSNVALTHALLLNLVLAALLVLNDSSFILLLLNGEVVRFQEAVELVVASRSVH
mmetsp:Transcript_5564/g.8758  ORF Transcript_5564/g.8758 Transcript_5564/m.8758 type:complete len:212 (+) Transcript_5564:393-1028(+)